MISSFSPLTREMWGSPMKLIGNEFRTGGKKCTCLHMLHNHQRMKFTTTGCGDSHGLRGLALEWCAKHFDWVAGCMGPKSAVFSSRCFCCRMIMSLWPCASYNRHSVCLRIPYLWFHLSEVVPPSPVHIAYLLLPVSILLHPNPNPVLE